jgi:hypothetical protein
MAKQEKAAKHHLIVYRFIARRYRPAGILLILMGILALLPTFVDMLKPYVTLIKPEQLAVIGIASLVLGFGLFIGSILGERQAYVQCLPQYLLVNTMFNRVFVSYQRINSTQPVQVARVFDIKTIKKGREKDQIKSLLGETALEVSLQEFPIPEKKLYKRFSRFLFSNRDKGFIFIVPKPTALSLEINTYMQSAMDTRNEDQQRYLDPIERLKYQNTKTY